MSDFKKLKVWRKAHALALNVHRVATHLRGQDQVSLKNQILRAAMSIPTNIVEGTGKGTSREFCRFLSIAVGSTSELEYHLMVARDTKILSNAEFDSLSSQTVEVRKMLCGLINKVRSTSRRPSTDGSVSV